MKCLSFFLRSIGVVTVATVSCFASTITADLGIDGVAQVGPTFINFGNYPLGTIFTPSPGYGDVIVSGQPGGVFASAGVTAGEGAMIQSLNAAMTPPGTVLTPNPTTASPFLTFNTTGSNLEVFLTELVPGSTLGPFNLADTPTGAVASFSIDGFAYNTTTKTMQDISGLFSATFAGTTVAQLEAEEASGTNVVANPFSGTLVITSVPEPTTLMLLGAGLLGIGLIARRRTAK